MRTVLLVIAASLASACVVEEPVGELPDVEIVGDDLAVDDWAVAESDAPWPEAARRQPTCQDHYAACMQTKLGSKEDDPGTSRCLNCMDRCKREGCWPKETYARRDCDYTKPKYRRRPTEVTEVVP